MLRRRRSTPHLRVSPFGTIVCDQGYPCVGPAA
jgi:hypothetical protein